MLLLINANESELKWEVLWCEFLIFRKVCDLKNSIEVPGNVWFEEHNFLTWIQVGLSTEIELLAGIELIARSTVKVRF